MSRTTSKAELITWLAALPEYSPDLERVDAVRRGMESAIPDEGQAMNLSSASKRAGYSRQVLYRAIAVGALRAFTPYPGGRQRVTERELAQWMAGRKEAT